MKFLRSVFGTVVALTAFVSAITVQAQEFSLINFQQGVQNISGGTLDTGDVLEYSITLNNYTVDPINGPSISALLPLGATYVDNSVAVTGGGTVSVSGGHTPTLTYSGPSLDPFGEIEITYQVTVTGSPLYMVDNSARPAILYNVNKADGSVEELSRFGGHRNVYGLALSSDARTLYGVDSYSHEVFKHDLVTEVTTTIGRHELDTQGPISVPCLDFDSSGTLWGVNAKLEYLFTIDPETGLATKGPDIDFNANGGDCAFGSDGKLYYASNYDKGGLWVVNTTDGSSTRVSQYDGSNGFTGVALGTEGTLFVSNHKKDNILNIAPTDGAISTLGSLNVPHNSGDLAMTAGQKIQIVSLAEYSDADGNTDESVIGFEMEGAAPAVGGGAPVDDTVLDPDAVWTTQNLCRVLNGQTTCTFSDEFDPFMRNYVDDVIEHHFGQLEDVAGDGMDNLALSDAAAITYLTQTHGIISTDKEAARFQANAMVDQWIADYKDQTGSCPHENQLMQNIREYLTHEQAKTAVKLKKYNNPDPQQCSLYGHDSTIRLGDTSILGWHSEGGTVTTLEPYIGGVGLSGTFRIRPQETNTFSLGLYDDTGLVKNCDYQVVVEAACDVGAHKKVIAQGSSTTLIWNADGNAVAEIDQGIGGVGLQGQTTVSPTVTTNYTMSVYKDGAANPYKNCEYEIIVVDNAVDKNILR